MDKAKLDKLLDAYAWAKEQNKASLADLKRAQIHLFAEAARARTSPWLPRNDESQVERLQRQVAEQAKTIGELAGQLHEAELAGQRLNADRVAGIFTGVDEALKHEVLRQAVMWLRGKCP